MICVEQFEIRTYVMENWGTVDNAQLIEHILHNVMTKVILILESKTLPVSKRRNHISQLFFFGKVPYISQLKFADII